MAEPNILLTRIDNRLIHGQVATQWNSTLGSNLILVANDEVSGNTMRQNLMKMAAPAGVATRFFSLQHTIDIIAKASPKQKILSWPKLRRTCLRSSRVECLYVRSTSATCTWQKASARWQVLSQLTTLMWLRSSGCRSLVWNWRSAAFLPNTLKTSKSCSSKLSGCFRKYLKRSIYYGL